MIYCCIRQIVSALPGLFISSTSTGATQGGALYYIKQSTHRYLHTDRRNRCLIDPSSLRPFNSSVRCKQRHKTTRPTRRISSMASTSIREVTTSATLEEKK